MVSLSLSHLNMAGIWVMSLLLPKLLMQNASSIVNIGEETDSSDQKKPAKSSGSSEVIWLTDVNNLPLGPCSRSSSRTSGLWHRASKVAIFVNKEDPHILIHIRDGSKRLYPLHADPAFGGIVDYGETYEQAAIREAREECGICLEPDNLVLVRPFSFHEDGVRCHSRIYAALFDGNCDDLKPQKGEVASIAKVRFADVDQYMAQQQVALPMRLLLRFVREFVDEGGLTNLLATSKTVGKGDDDNGDGE